MEVHETNQISVRALIQQWMEETGNSLINLVSVSGIEYTRLKKIEQGDEKATQILTEPELIKLIRILK